MTFEEALAAMKEGKIVTDGISEYRIIKIIQHRTIGSCKDWNELDQFFTDEIQEDHWQIVEGKE